MSYVEKSILSAKMDSALNVAGVDQLQDEETNSCNQVDFIETFPLTRNIDGCNRTECDSGDWSAEGMEENLTVVKQESDDVCCSIYVICSLSQKSDFLQFLRNRSNAQNYVCIFHLFVS